MNPAPDEPPEDPFPNLPHRFDRHELRCRIGMGGMGIVYEARHIVLNLMVALKVPRYGRHCSPEVRELFLRESRIGAELRKVSPRGQNASVCDVFDGGTVDGCPYFTMEFLNGRSLDAYWRAERSRLGPSGAGDLIQRVARLMARVHTHKFDGRFLVHRDIKPSNIMAIPVPGEPEPHLVVLDFGLSLTVNPGGAAQPGVWGGTPGYMPPEQLVPGWRANEIGPRSDVYALGAVLYTLICDHPPFLSDDYNELVTWVLNLDVPRPGELGPAYSAYDQICRRALARNPTDRYQTMDEFADALAVVYLDAMLTDPVSPSGGGTMNSLSRFAIPAGSVRYAFVPYGYTTPTAFPGHDRLFLDVGNRLGPGVIDHHQLRGAGPTAKLVYDCAGLIDAAVSPTRDPENPFTIVLHNYPDLDAVASALFAVEYLTNRTFPARMEALLQYVERVDAGETRLDPQHPFSLHVAFTRLLARSLDRGSQQERDLAIVRDGLALLDFVIKETNRTGKPIEQLDAFAAPVFTQDDRDAVLADRDRYRAKLALPATRARRCRLRLAGRDGIEKAVEGLLARDVQNASDPTRVAYFKDWARGDTTGSRDGNGFAAVSVFLSEEVGHPRRCILSVTPECGASLKGLGQLLDEAEAELRVRAFGVDNRKHNPATGDPLQPRTGYDNTDPWYDGRGHDYTIIDAPRAGTLLSANEIERIFLAFGRASEIEAV